MTQDSERVVLLIVVFVLAMHLFEQWLKQDKPTFFTALLQKHLSSRCLVFVHAFAVAVSFLMFFMDQLWFDDGRDKQLSSMCGIVTSISALLAYLFDSASGNQREDVLSAKMHMMHEVSNLNFLRADLKQQQQDARLQSLEESLRRLEAGQRRLEAGQQQPEAGQRQPEAGQQHPEAGQRQPEAGQQQPEAGQRQPEAGQRQPGMRNEPVNKDQAANDAKARAQRIQDAVDRIQHSVKQIKYCATTIKGGADNIKGNAADIRGSANDIERLLRGIQVIVLEIEREVNPQGILATDAIDEYGKARDKIRGYANTIQMYVDAVQGNGNRTIPVAAVQERAKAIQASANAIKPCVNTFVDAGLLPAANNVLHPSKSLCLMKRKIYFKQLDINEMSNPDGRTLYEVDASCVPNATEWEYLGKFGITRVPEPKITFVDYS